MTTNCMLTKFCQKIVPLTIFTKVITTFDLNCQDSYFHEFSCKQIQRKDIMMS